MQITITSVNSLKKDALMTARDGRVGGHVGRGSFGIIASGRQGWVKWVTRVVTQEPTTE